MRFRRNLLTSNLLVATIAYAFTDATSRDPQPHQRNSWHASTRKGKLLLTQETGVHPVRMIALIAVTRIFDNKHDVLRTNG